MGARCCRCWRLLGCAWLGHRSAAIAGAAQHRRHVLEQVQLVV
jgi:hypothetical protein